jgi:hypothetical protein
MASVANAGATCRPITLPAGLAVKRRTRKLPSHPSHGSRVERASPGMPAVRPSELVFATVTALLALVQTACGASADALGEVGTYSDGGDGSLGFAPGADGDGGVQVSVTSSARSICAGQCVDLSVAATGGQSPYTYAWTGGGLTASTASLHACPTATTTYTVTASDSSGTTGDLVLAMARGTATSTVTVGPTCASDAGAGPPPQFARELCSVRWPLVQQSPSLLSDVPDQATVAGADAAGNTLFAVTFNGTLTASGTTFTSRGWSDTLVAKLDPQCHVLWTKQFGAVGAGIYTTNVTSDAASDVILGGYFTGSVDFGSGAQPAAVEARSFVVALTASGAPLWGGPEHGGILTGLASDPKGEVAFTMDGSEADFDAGAPANAPFDGVVKLNASGAQIAAVDQAPLGGFSRSGTLLNLAMNASGTVALVGPGNSVGTNDSESLVGAAAEIAPDGSPLWSVQLAPPVPPAQFMPAQLDRVNAAVDPGGDAFAFGGWQSVSSDTSSDQVVIDPGTVTRISAAGHILWTATTTNDILPVVAFGASASALDAADDTFVAGSLAGTATFGAVGTVTSAGPFDVAFAVYGPSGALRSAGTWGAAGESSSLGSIAIDGSAVLLAGVTSSGPGADVFVARLGW